MTEQGLGTLAGADDPAAEQVPEIGAAPTADAYGWRFAPVAPWRRYGARLLDMVVNGSAAFFLLGLVLFLIAPESADIFFSIFDGAGGRIADLMMTLLVSGFVDAIVMFMFGSTLGKYIFGIRVRSKDGSRLSLGQCFSREIQVWIMGWGAGIPILSLFTLINGYQRLNRNGSARWDDDAFAVSYRPGSATQTLLNICGIAIIVAGHLLINWLGS